MHLDQGGSRELPEWLIGLLIAVVLAVVVIGVAMLLGAGDDPRIATDPPAATSEEG